MFTSTLKPGLLVSMKTSVKGGADYIRTEIEQEHTNGDGERVAKWQTTRTIRDPAEYERAIKARGAARSAIIGACNQTSFGLLCPVARESELRTAIEVARIIADDFNATAQHSTIEVYVITGRVAQDDVEAARAVAAEVRELMESMTAAIKLADVDSIREAANKARALGGMLTEEAAAKVSAAVAEARSAARAIVKRVEKGAEDAAKVVAAISVKDIEAARFAFLDIPDATAPAAVPVEPIAVAAPAVELVPVADILKAEQEMAQQPAPELE